MLLKQAADLHTSTFIQMVAYEAAKDGFLDQHVKLIRQVYRERRDAMLHALEEFFPPEVTWTHPKGGLFLWTTLPRDVDCRLLFRSALAEEVAFVPGDCFYANDVFEGGRHMRLSGPLLRTGADSRRHSAAFRGSKDANSLRGPSLSADCGTLKTSKLIRVADSSCWFKVK